MVTARTGILGRLSTLALAGLLAATSANAQDWSAEIGLVSDYRYRGLSLSDRKPALQASLTLEHDSGLYTELWGSSLAKGSASRAEVDATVGYAIDLTETLSADVSATYYAYPGAAEGNALEITGTIEASRGPLTASVGLRLAPPQGGTRDELGAKRLNAYVFTGVEYALQSTPLTLRAAIGHERGPWDMASQGGKWDWSVGAGAELRNVRVGLDLICSNVGDETVAGSLALTF
jgi:uncharacterized protein (TIGR02001 family)